MAAAEITPAMVLEVTSISRERAERIAAYASLRFGGLIGTEAAREAGLTYAATRSYEKWLPLLRAKFDLPVPPKGHPIGGVSFERYREKGRSGGHQTHHVQRGIVAPDCELCRDGVR